MTQARRPGPTGRRAAGDPPAGNRRGSLIALQVLLVAVGGACVSWWAVDMASASLASARAGRRLQHAISAQTRVASPGASNAPAPAVQVGDPLGWISIPRIGVKTVIVEGDDDLTLSFAAGHIPGTALPGASGNLSLAGHRDSVFSGLGRVHNGDLIVVTTPVATYRYAVESTRVVQPEDVGVLSPGGKPALTLITCYPFGYVGPAPQRFIVRATLLPAVSDKRKG